MIKRSICATKSIKKAALLALMMVGLAACTTQEQPTAHDYGVVTSGDFEFMKNGVTTYSWHPRLEQVYLSQKYEETVVTDMVRIAIDDQLSAKGYSREQGGVVLAMCWLVSAYRKNQSSMTIRFLMRFSFLLVFHSMMAKVNWPKKAHCTLCIRYLILK